MIQLLRRLNIRLGPLAGRFAEGYAACESCGTPWKYVDGHRTCFALEKDAEQGITRSIVVLCVRCWAEHSKISRLAFHKRVWERWLLAGRDRRDWWPAIESAVLSGQ